MSSSIQFCEISKISLKHFTSTTLSTSSLQRQPIRRRRRAQKWRLLIWLIAALWVSLFDACAVNVSRPVYGHSPSERGRAVFFRLSAKGVPRWLERTFFLSVCLSTSFTPIGFCIGAVCDRNMRKLFYYYIRHSYLWYSWGQFHN